MNDKFKRLMELNHVASLTKPEPPKDVRITREDFDLLDVQEDNTIYHIYEEDGSITTIKGVN